MQGLLILFGSLGGKPLDKGSKTLPDKTLFLARIGFEAAYKIGGFNGRRKW
jgi:hypothetical protein